jgi:23S rRNA (guanosine2251-2'-O)-methyltransferase
MGPRRTEPEPAGTKSPRIDPRLGAARPAAGARAAEEALSGRRAVAEALRAGHPLRKILISRAAHGETIREIIHEARQRGITVQFVEPQHLPGRTDARGVAALSAARSTVEVEDILAAAAGRGEPPFVLILDGVEDPANLGAVLRTAEGAGVHGVIIPRRRAAGLTQAVARASAGAVEHMPVAAVTNLVRTLEDMKRAGLWVVGADMTAPQLYHEVHLLPPLAVVMGGEGQGLSRLVRERCDLLVRLPMRGKVGSLNVSVAAGIILYDIVRQMGTVMAGNPGLTAGT